MTYSRRQLYAMGEPLGDGATRMEVGGKIIYGGGGGSPPPKPTTTITESGPTVMDMNRTTVNEIPEYLTGASQDLVARGQALTARPYEAYTGARVSEFSPLMNQAFGRMGGQQVAGQIGQATGLAGLAGQRAMQVGSSLGPYDPYQSQAPAQYAAGQYNPYTEQATAQYAAGQYNPYEMGGFDAQRAQQYMNPYMQSVVDVERRKAQEASDRQSAQLSSQAAKTGAFGGSGAALQQRALRRDTAQQLGDIQTQGMGRAYDQGLARFGAEEAMREQSRQYGSGFGESSRQFGAQFGEAALRAEREMAERSRQFGANFGESSRQFGAQFGEASLQAERARQEASRQFGASYGMQGEQLGLEGLRTGLSASGQLGQLGQQQFAQEMDITKGLGTAGDVQRQREQALLDVGYQDYLTAQKYPYEQLAFQQGLVAGVPYSTTQRVSGQEVTQPGKQVQQTITGNAATPSGPPGKAAGGEIKSYAVGGIASLNQPQMASAASGMSDQQLQQTQGLPSITQLVLDSLQAEEKLRARKRQAAQAQMAQRPQGTVADDERARIAAMEQGLGGLDVPDDLVGDEYTAAGGGIVAFQSRGEVPEPEEPLERQREEDRRKIKSAYESGRISLEEFGRAIADIAALPVRGVAGAYDSAVVRPMRAAGLNAGYLSPYLVPEGVDPDSMTPFSDQMRSRTPTAAPAQPTGIASLTDGSDSRFTRTGGPAVGGITDQAPAKATPKPGEETKAKDTGTAGPARPSTKFLDDAYGRQEELLREASEKETAAQKEYMKDLEKDGKETGDFASKARQKIEQRMAGLEGADRSALESSVLDFGLRLLATKGEKNMAKALAGAGLDTIAGHKQALKEIAAKRDKYDDALAKVDEFEYGERKGTAKERRAALLGLGKAEAALSKDLAGLVGDQTKDLFQLYRDDRAHNRAVQLAGMRASGSGEVSKAVKDAEAAFARDPQALAIKRQLENPIIANNRTKKAAAENELRLIRADKYRQFGATLETDTAGATGSDSDPLGIL